MYLNAKKYLSMAFFPHPLVNNHIAFCCSSDESALITTKTTPHHCLAEQNENKFINRQVPLSSAAQFLPMIPAEMDLKKYNIASQACVPNHLYENTNSSFQPIHP